MKNLIVYILLVTLLLAGIASFAVKNSQAIMVQGATMMDMKHKATFHKHAYFGGDIVIRSVEELDAYAQQIIAEFKKDNAQVPPGYWLSQGKQIVEFYSRYDKKFFKNKNLILAKVDQGSGSVSYKLKNLEASKGVLSIDVQKISPMAQTMDYVTWVLFLELDKSVDVDKIKVNLV